MMKAALLLLLLISLLSLILCDVSVEKDEDDSISLLQSPKESILAELSPHAREAREATGKNQTAVAGKKKSAGKNKGKAKNKSKKTAGKTAKSPDNKNKTTAAGKQKSKSAGKAKKAADKQKSKKNKADQSGKSGKSKKTTGKKSAGGKGQAAKKSKKSKKNGSATKGKKGAKKQKNAKKGKNAKGKKGNKSKGGKKSGKGKATQKKADAKKKSGNKQKANKKKLSKGSSRQSSCPAGQVDSTCIANAIQAMEFEENQLTNFQKQYSRIAATNNIVGLKLQKNGTFESVKSSLLQALGGNSSNLVCSDSSNGSSSLGDATTAYKILDSCKAAVANNCSMPSSLWNSTVQAKLTACAALMNNFIAQNTNCSNFNSSTDACSCWSKQITALNDFTAQKCIATSSQVDKDTFNYRGSCTGTFSNCQKTQMGAVTSVSACTAGTVKSLASLQNVTMRNSGGA